MTEKINVEIKNFAFGPKTLTVKKGTTIVWTNQDSVGHTATSDDGNFDTGLLEKGESKSVTFDEAGTFTYHCTPHPYMKATIVVE
ncbi:MAG: cupredoxin family copper-binding protein [Candidatus Levybacteria bacterium]|nr:cupredoxin family copper-binding protein [Candidatus Levybacteria bacterium]